MSRLTRRGFFGLLLVPFSRRQETPWDAVMRENSRLKSMRFGRVLMTTYPPTPWVKVRRVG